MSTAKMTTKGQITVPKDVRKALAIEAGDRICFRIREDGVVELVPETLDILELFGAVEPEIRGVSVEQMNEDVRAAAGDDRG
jgi:AbrB family looped-hinge helix DNA binding protein